MCGLVVCTQSACKEMNRTTDGILDGNLNHGSGSASGSGSLISGSGSTIGSAIGSAMPNKMRRYLYAGDQKGANATSR